jgi:hypothetical protein
MDDPNLAYDRMDKELASDKKSTTLAAPPTLPIAATEAVDPSLAAARKLRPDPRCAKFKTLTQLPNLTAALTLNDELKCEKLRIETALPSLDVLRRLKELPKCAKLM